MPKRAPRIYQDDTPEVIDPEREALRGLDDATVARMTTPAAKAEIQERLRLERCWSGEWTSGPDSPVPPPFARANRRFL